MSNENKSHLDPERIIASFVDDRGLSPQEREHLSGCPACTAARERLASQLTGLAEQAGRHTPESFRRVVLPAEQPANPLAWIMRWSMGVAAAAATVAIVAALLLGRLFPGGVGETDQLKLAQETVRDATLLAEVRALENDPLPGAYAEIIPDPGVSLDEEFFDFLIPLEAEGDETQRT